MGTAKLGKLLDLLRKDKKTALCAAAGGIGVLLLLISGGVKQKESGAAAWDQLCAEREQALEKKAEKLLSSVSGVGKVRVVVTLERLDRYEYATNAESRGEAGGSDTHVIVSGNGRQDGLTQTVVMPAVRGVAVCCQGGGSPQVRREVCGLMCAAFGIPENRVYISPMGK